MLRLKTIAVRPPTGIMSKVIKTFVRFDVKKPNDVAIINDELSTGEYGSTVYTDYLKMVDDVQAVLTERENVQKLYSDEDALYVDARYGEIYDQIVTEFHKKYSTHHDPVISNIAKKIT